MFCCLLECLCLLAIAVHAGPLVLKKPRPVAGPLVDAAQWKVHHRFLKVEKEALQMSLDVSRIARTIIAKAYLKTEEGQTHLQGIRDIARKEMLLSKGECDEGGAIIRAVNKTIEKARQSLFKCEHGIANKMADYELKMTIKIIEGRSHVLEVKKAMWLCQKKQAKVDEHCLRKLTKEGMEIVDNLLHTTRPVLLEAQSSGEEALRKIDFCFENDISEATQKIVEFVERLRECSLAENEV